MLERYILPQHFDGFPESSDTRVFRDSKNFTQNLSCEEVSVVDRRWQHAPTFSKPDLNSDSWHRPFDQSMLGGSDRVTDFLSDQGNGSKNSVGAASLLWRWIDEEEYGQRIPLAGTAWPSGGGHPPSRAEPGCDPEGGASRWQSLFSRDAVRRSVALPPAGDAPAAAGAGALSRPTEAWRCPPLPSAQIHASRADREGAGGREGGREGERERERERERDPEGER